MELRNLTEIWISKYTSINNHGEQEKSWSYKGKAYLNLQQDVNELDRKSTGEVDYTVLNGRTQNDYNIEKGDGISLTDISETENIIPDYLVTAYTKIGQTILYKMEKNNAS